MLNVLQQQQTYIWYNGILELRFNHFQAVHTRVVVQIAADTYHLHMKYDGEFSIQKAIVFNTSSPYGAQPV